MHDTRPVLAWLDDPDTVRGIRFATDGDRWEVWTYAGLAEAVRRVAAGLRAAGVRSDDVVSIVLPSGPTFVAALFGTLVAGATASPIAPPLAFQDRAAYGEHVAGLLATSRPRLLVTNDELAGDMADRAGPAAAPEIVTVAELMHTDDDPAPRRQAELALLQFTSGSSGHPRGVHIPFAALEANVRAIRRWLRMTRDDATASWLPVHHDMGLIGCLITPIVNESDLWLMKPEQFVRSPIRYLRCFGERGASLTAMPNFGLAYITRRVAPAALQGLDFSAWRTVIVGAERLDSAVFDRFHRLLAPHGFRRSSLLPAYGLAEATLAVTGLAADVGWRSVPVCPDSLAIGRPVEVAAGVAPAHPVMGCGTPVTDVHVRIVDDDGRDLPDAHVGEIVVEAPSVAAGYLTASASESLTTIDEGRLRTGDVGFLLDGELFVLGRLGDSIKVRGMAVFAEDLEAALVAAGLPVQRLAVALGVRGSLPTAVVALEHPGDGWAAVAERAVRPRLDGTDIVVAAVPRGAIGRTSSGKPKRRLLWKTFLDGTLPMENASLTPTSQ